MEATSIDFAHPVVKTAGCLIAISAEPIVVTAHVFSVNSLPAVAFVTAAIITLTGLDVLCGRSGYGRRNVPRREFHSGMTQKSGATHHRAA